MESAFFCDMAALTAGQRERHHSLARQIIPAAQGFSELADGYAASFSPDTGMLLAVAEFISLERLCCPFLTLGLEIERDDGPLWLRVTRPQGVKPFIRAEFGLPDTPGGTGG